MTGAAVLDASAAVRAVMDAAGQPALLDRIGGAAAVLAPTLLRAEVGNALRKYARAGVIEVSDLPDRHREGMALVHLFVEEASLFPEALIVAAGADQPVYDTLYALTARRHAAVLLPLTAGCTACAGTSASAASGLPQAEAAASVGARRCAINAWSLPRPAPGSRGKRG